MPSTHVEVAHSIFKFASLCVIHFVNLVNCGYADLYLRSRVSDLHSWFFMIKILKERESGYQLMTLLWPIWVAQPTPLVTGVLVYEPKLGLVAKGKALFYVVYVSVVLLLIISVGLGCVICRFASLYILFLMGSRIFSFRSVRFSLVGWFLFCVLTPYI